LIFHLTPVGKNLIEGTKFSRETQQRALVKFILLRFGFQGNQILIFEDWAIKFDK